jgi:hypothetical protein
MSKGDKFTQYLDCLAGNVLPTTTHTEAIPREGKKDLF